jgi:hypothetical protein
LAKRIFRIGLYFYPPDELVALLQRVWSGALNEDRACELVARHAGECPLWGVHGTLLDAIAIIEEDRGAFIEAMTAVLARHEPLVLTHPDIKEWGMGDNVFLRWRKDEQRERLKALREELLETGRPFIVTEALDWEKVNEVDRMVRLAGTSEAVLTFAERLRHLKAILHDVQPTLCYAPNIPLEWYVANLNEGATLPSDTLPFGLEPHISVASAVRADDTYGWTASQVGAYIKEHLRQHPDFRPLLGPTVQHTIGTAYIVQPAAPSDPIEVTVVDRITGEARREFRQPWICHERIAFGARPHPPGAVSF